MRPPAKAESLRRRASSQGRLSFKKSRSRSPAKPSARACSATAPRESSDSDSDAGARKQQVPVSAVKRTAQTQTLYSMLLFESRSNERLERERRALQQMQQRASPKKAASNPHMDRLKILQYENSPRPSPVDARHAVSQATRSTSPPRRLSPTRQALTTPHVASRLTPVQPRRCRADRTSTTCRSTCRLRQHAAMLGRKL